MTQELPPFLLFELSQLLSVSFVLQLFDFLLLGYVAVLQKSDPKVLYTRSNENWYLQRLSSKGSKSM